MSFLAPLPPIGPLLRALAMSFLFLPVLLAPAGAAPVDAWQDVPPCAPDGCGFRVLRSYTGAPPCFSLQTSCTYRVHFHVAADGWLDPPTLFCEGGGSGLLACSGTKTVTYQTSWPLPSPCPNVPYTIDVTGVGALTGHVVTRTISTSFNACIPL